MNDSKSDSGVGGCSDERSLAEFARSQSQALGALGTSVQRGLEEADIVLPPEERKKVGLAIERIVEQSQGYSGPQPSPSMLKEYERICPGSAKRLLEMGFAEQNHRHNCDERELNQKTTSSRWSIEMPRTR